MLYCCNAELFCETSCSRFKVTFQSLVPKFVLIIPNYNARFAILRGNLQRRIQYFGTLVQYFGTLVQYFGTLVQYFGTLVPYFGTLNQYFGTLV